MARHTTFDSISFPQLVTNNPNGISRAKRTTPIQKGAASTPVNSKLSASPVPTMPEVPSQITYPISTTNSITITTASVLANCRTVWLEIAQSVEPVTWLIANFSSVQFPLVIAVAIRAVMMSIATPVEIAEGAGIGHKQYGEDNVNPGQK